MSRFLAGFADEFFKLATKAPTGPSRDPFQGQKNESEQTLFKGQREKVEGTPEVKRRVGALPSVEQAASKPYTERVQPIPLKPIKPAGS